MNWEQIEGKWDQFKGQARQQWAKFTDDDLGKIKGKKDEVAGLLKERYGYEKERAEEEMKNFSDSCGCDSSKKK